MDNTQYKYTMKMCQVTKVLRVGKEHYTVVYWLYWKVLAKNSGKYKTHEIDLGGIQLRNLNKISFW